MSEPISKEAQAVIAALGTSGKKIVALVKTVSGKVVQIPAPAPVPAPVVIPPAQPTAVRYVNLKAWGGLAWALTIAGAVYGAVIALNVGEYFFPDTPDQLQWLRWLTLWLFPVFSFCVGGTIGSFIEMEQSVKQETIVA